MNDATLSQGDQTRVTGVMNDLHSAGDQTRVTGVMNDLHSIDGMEGSTPYNRLNTGASIIIDDNMFAAALTHFTNFDPSGHFEHNNQEGASLNAHEGYALYNVVGGNTSVQNCVSGLEVDKNTGKAALSPRNGVDLISAKPTSAGSQKNIIVPQKRVRFNANQPEVQRRYRERKKERMTELETKVEELKAQVQQLESEKDQAKQATVKAELARQEAEAVTRMLALQSKELGRKEGGGGNNRDVGGSDLSSNSGAQDTCLIEGSFNVDADNSAMEMGVDAQFNTENMFASAHKRIMGCFKSGDKLPDWNDCLRLTRMLYGGDGFFDVYSSCVDHLNELLKSGASDEDIRVAFMRMFEMCAKQKQSKKEFHFIRHCTQNVQALKKGKSSEIAPSDHHAGMLKEDSTTNKDGEVTSNQEEPEPQEEPSQQRQREEEKVDLDCPMARSFKEECLYECNLSHLHWPKVTDKLEEDVSKRELRKMVDWSDEYTAKLQEIYRTRQRLGIQIAFLSGHGTVPWTESAFANPEKKDMAGSPAEFKNGATAADTKENTSAETVDAVKVPDWASSARRTPTNDAATEKGAHAAQHASQQSTGKTSSSPRRMDSPTEFDSFSGCPRATDFVMQDHKNLTKVFSDLKANMQEELTMVYDTNKQLLTQVLSPRTAAYLFVYSHPLPPDPVAVAWELRRRATA